MDPMLFPLIIDHNSVKDHLAMAIETGELSTQEEAQAEKLLAAPNATVNKIILYALKATYNDDIDAALDDFIDDAAFTALGMFAKDETDD